MTVVVKAINDVATHIFLVRTELKKQLFDLMVAADQYEMPTDERMDLMKFILHVGVDVGRFVDACDEHFTELRGETAAYMQEAAERENMLMQREKALSQEVGQLQRRCAELEKTAWLARDHARSNTIVRERVLAVTGGVCFYCQTPLNDDPSASEPTFHVDHIVARSHGGPDHISNYLPACRKCNLSKGDKTFVEFIQTRAIKPDLKVVASNDGAA